MPDQRTPEPAGDGGETSIEQLIRNLQPGVDRSLQLRALIYGLSIPIEVVADLAQTKPTAVQHWLRRDGKGGLPEFVDDARAISLRILISGSLRPDEVGRWLLEPNELLGSRTPIETLKQGRYEDVLVASQAAAGGGFNPLSEPLAKRVEFGWMQIDDLANATYEWPGGSFDDFNTFWCFKGGPAVQGLDNSPRTMWSSQIFVGVGYKSNGDVVGFYMNREMTWKRPAVYFRRTDDFEATGEAMSVIRGRGEDGLAGIPDREQAPAAYASFRVEPYKSRIAGGTDCLAIVIGPRRLSHLGFVLDHVALQMKARGVGAFRRSLGTELDRLLRSVFTWEGAEEWLDAPNPEFQGRTPSEVFRSQGPEPISGSLLALAEGVFS